METITENSWFNYILSMFMKKIQASWRHKQIFSDIIGLKIIFIIIIIIIISIFTPLQLDFFHYLIK